LYIPRGVLGQPPLAMSIISLEKYPISLYVPRHGRSHLLGLHQMNLNHLWRQIGENPMGEAEAICEVSPSLVARSCYG